VSRLSLYYEDKQSSSKEQEQVKLSELCEELLKLWYSSNMLEEEEEVKFWNAFKDFYKHADTAKQRYNIEDLIRELDKLRIDIQTIWQKKRAAKLSAADEQELNYGQTILRNFNSVIELVRNIKDKSEEIEGQKTQRISSKWAAQFLAGYYNVISYAGSINLIKTVMEAEAIIGYDNQRIVTSRLLTFRTLVLGTAREIKSLEILENPEKIKRLLLNLDKDTQSLLDIFKKERYSNPSTIIHEFKSLDFSGSIKLIYEEVLNTIPNE
jgi:hypothetical protein